MSLRNEFLLCLAVFGCSTLVHAGDDIAVGKIVVLKKTPVEVYLVDPEGKPRVAGLANGLVYRVLRAEESWLLIHTRTGLVWLDRQNALSPDDAAAHYRDRVKAEPADADAWARLGVAVGLAGDFDDGIRCLTEALKLKPNVSEWLHKRSGFWMAQRLVEPCWSDLLDAARLDPRNGFIVSDQAAVWAHKGDKDKSRACFEEAIRLDPHCSDAYCHRAMDHEDKGDFERALADYTKALELNPGQVQVYNNRALLLLARGGYDDQVIRDTTDCIKYGGLPQQVLGMRAQAWAKKGEADKAIADCDEMLGYFPRHGAVLCVRALAWRMKGDRARAIADLEQAAGIDPSDGATRMNLGTAYREDRSWMKARLQFQMASLCKGTEIDGLNALAWLLATCPDDQVRDGAQALVAARQACESTQWKRPKLLDTLAAAYAESGNFEEAVRWEQAALAHPSYGSAAAARERLQLYAARQAYREK